MATSPCVHAAHCCQPAPGPLSWQEGSPVPPQGSAQLRATGTLPGATPLPVTPHPPGERCLQPRSQLSARFYYPTPKLTSVILPPPSSPHPPQQKKKKNEEEKEEDQGPSRSTPVPQRRAGGQGTGGDTARAGGSQAPPRCSLLQLRCSPSSWGPVGPVLCWGRAGGRTRRRVPRRSRDAVVLLAGGCSPPPCADPAPPKLPSTAGT